MLYIYQLCDDKDTGVKINGWYHISLTIVIEIHGNNWQLLITLFCLHEPIVPIVK